jgi:transglutaminase-like putative cysteine protease
MQICDYCLSHNKHHLWPAGGDACVSKRNRRLTRLTIEHRTVYDYRAQVSLGPHRLLLRPRDGFELRVLRHELKLVPEARLTWAQDVFDNAIGTASFLDSVRRLEIESSSEVDLTAENWPIFSIGADAISYPFSYSKQDQINLGALAEQEYAAQASVLTGWAQKFIRRLPTDTLSLLKELSVGVASEVFYDARDEEGTQSPAESLMRRRGSCRDLAVLFVETARALGFAGRLVSGYLYDPGHDRVGSSGAGSTHAWAELYVPGAGWIAFDPTNGGLGGANLIPVAVGRTMLEIMPVVGSFAGPADALQSMTVEVKVVPSGT